MVLGVTLLATLGPAFRIKDLMLDNPIALIKPTFIVGRHVADGPALHAELPAEGV
jgi:hypothetical protein